MSLADNRRKSYSAINRSRSADVSGATLPPSTPSSPRCRRSRPRLLAPVTGPSPEQFAGDSPAQVSKRLFNAMRPKFFPASVLPVLAGSAWGFMIAGQFDLPIFLLALFATVCVHFGANVINDVGDESGGVMPDVPTPPGTLRLIALSMIDADHQLLPDSITLPFLWLGLTLSLFPVFADMRSSLIGAIAGCMVSDGEVARNHKARLLRDGAWLAGFTAIAAIAGKALPTRAVPSFRMANNATGAAQARHAHENLPWGWAPALHRWYHRGI